MAKMWDDGMKRLFWAEPQDFVSWLMPGAEYVDKVTLELKNLTRTVIPDALYRINVDGQIGLLHVEFQKRADPEMANRVWEYNVRATLQYKCPVYSFVIYLRPVSGIPESAVTWGFEKYGRVHDFRFTNVKLWELPQEALRETGLVGLLPLLILTKDGEQHSVAEQVFDELREAGKNELLSVALLLAGLVFTDESEKRWLERRRAMLEEILRDSWIYQDILREGLEEGREKGLEEGLEKGLEKGLAKGLEKGLEEGREEGIRNMRLSILDIVKVRFPAIVDVVKKGLDSIDDPMLLRRLNLKMSTATDANEAARALFRITEGEEEQ
jgi:predicted transposase YdaD